MLHDSVSRYIVRLSWIGRIPFQQTIGIGRSVYILICIEKVVQDLRRGCPECQSARVRCSRCQKPTSAKQLVHPNRVHSIADPGRQSCAVKGSSTTGLNCARGPSHSWGLGVSLHGSCRHLDVSCACLGFLHDVVLRPSRPSGACPTVARGKASAMYHSMFGPTDRAEHAWTFRSVSIGKIMLAWRLDISSGNDAVPGCG